MEIDELEIRRMDSSESEKVAHVDCYAYQNDPIIVTIFQSNNEELRKKREQDRINYYTNNPQETFVGIHEEKIIGFIRSFPCTGLFKQLEYSEGEYEQILDNRIEDLSFEQRQKWWFMTMKKHDLQTPHSHVGPFGVLPEYHGLGVGTRLLEDYFSRLDGVPSFLETFTSSNARFYKKRGYSLVSSDDVLGMKGYWLKRD